MVGSVLVQCNLVENQYQQKSKVLCTFTPNKFYAYPLNVEPSNIAFYRIYNTDFNEIIVIFTHQNGRQLEVEDNLTLLLNKWKLLIIL